MLLFSFLYGRFDYSIFESSPADGSSPPESSPPPGSSPASSPGSSPESSPGESSPASSPSDGTSPEASYPFTVTLTNPGAETGDATGWTQILNSGPQARASGADVPAHAGSFYFAVSANQEQPWWGQTYDVASGFYEDIDVGFVKAVLSVYHRGFSGDTDSAAIAVEAFDESNVWLAGAFTSHADPSDWTLRSVELLLPPSTRKVRVSARGYRFTGTQNSAYLDDFDLQLDLSGYRDSELLYSIEGASTSGWTVNAGTLNTNTGAAKFNETILFGQASATLDIHRDIVIPSKHLTDVAAGNAIAQLYAQHGSFEDADAGRIFMSFLDDMDSVISTVEEAASPVVADRRFDPVSLNGSIPTNAKKIRIGITGTRNLGSNLDAYYCRIACLIASNA